VAAPDEVSLSLLNALALRADNAGHIVLTADEVRFALSRGGNHWLQPVDELRSLYKLTELAKDLGLKVDRPSLTPKRGRPAKQI
jgi:hypothetical protein